MSLTYEKMGQDLREILENVQNDITKSLVIKHLEKNGVVTLDEATFFAKLSSEVLTEASGDFIPDTIQILEDEDMVPVDAAGGAEGAGDVDPSGAIVLFDEAGNKYLFQDGQLVPADDDADDNAPVDPAAGDVAPSDGAELAENTDPTQADATTENKDQKQLEENTDLTQADDANKETQKQELFEESTIVSKILASL